MTATPWTSFPGGMLQCRLDADWTLESANETFFHFMGYSPQEYAKQFSDTFRLAVHPDDRELLHTALLQPATPAGALAEGFRLLSHTGIRWVWCNIRLLPETQDWQCCFTDMTTRIRALENPGTRINGTRDSVPEDLVWNRNRETWRLLLDTIPCGIALMAQTDGYRIIQANRTMCHLLGLTTVDFRDVPRRFADYIHPDSLDPLERTLSRLQNLPEGESVSIDFPILNDSGSIVWLHNTVRLMEMADGSMGYQCVFTDITEQKRAELKYADASMQDSLTGLYNRRAFEALVSARLDAGQRLSAFIIMDLDDFKKANDQFGHAYGDEILLALSEILKRNLRNSDIIGRLGGDEFAVFMENAGSERNVRHKIQELYEAVAHYTSEQNDFVLSISMGIALTPKHGSTFQALYLQADKALYTAKQQGKSQASFLE